MLFHRKILVSGIVQGVGFRPFCARLAEKLGLAGSVRNTSGGVEVELTGEPEVLDRYLHALSTENPPASVITSAVVLEDRRAEDSGETAFRILESKKEEELSVLIPPDLAVCDDCVSEMRDPSDRRYRYPFINCTNCGPRYTIIRDLPYDRPKTAMAPFAMCPSCSREYHDSFDRRFHAQPNACFDCGPSVWLADGGGTVLCRGDEAVRKCSAFLEEGRIVAVKGIGGFHIACTPFSDETVTLLRQRKGRKDKPFAVMASSMEEAERIAYIPGSARDLLLSPRKPIVLCCRRTKYPLSELVAPGQKTVGLLLPYSPLHLLILEEKKALIMTSANFSDEPIVSSNEKALSALAGIADFFLLHDREIYMAIDDSVAAPLGRSYFLLRRARGYTPAPMAIQEDTPVILGAGAEMKSTFCVSKGNLVFPGQYLGDMKQRETAAYFGRAMKHFMTLYGLSPEYLVHDLHPQFLSTAAALMNLPSFEGERLAVQHHHAHLAACLLENGVRSPAIGAIFDGTGYGPDGTVWGGEFLVGDCSKFSRKGHFHSSRLPGGDAAVMEPWRYGLSLLAETMGPETALPLGEKLWPARKAVIRQVLSVLRISPLTTSCGRFFDGVSALLGLAEKITFDGQAAMALEGIAEGGRISAPFTVENREGHLILDWRPAVRWLMENRGTMRKELIAGAMHTGLAHGVAEVCCRLAEDTGIRDVALSGGVWQNRRLTATVKKLLVKRGLNPLLHRLVPPNDECVSVGQVAIGAEKWKKK